MDGTTDSYPSDNWNNGSEFETQNLPLSTCSALTIYGQEAHENHGKDGIIDSYPGDNWNNEDEFEIQTLPLSTCSALTIYGQEACKSHEEASTSAGPSRSNLIYHFVGMGFSKDMVAKAIEENGEDNIEVILEALLTCSALENSLPECELIPSDPGSSESGKTTLNDFSDAESCLGDEEDVEHLSAKEKKLLHLVDMGFLVDEASAAIDACDPDTSIMELMDFICAAQLAKTADGHLQGPSHLISDDDELCSKPDPSHYHCDTSTVKKKRKLFEAEDRWERKQDSWKRKENKYNKTQKKLFVHEHEETVHIPKPMVGFGVPNRPMPFFQRTLTQAAIGPPYFYYENVACTPKGVWSTISRFLYDIEPEFVDSVYFCACARKRGYLHNLPIHNRFPLLPIPPRTIQETLPQTKKWWPSWDQRTTLNCLQTCMASAKLTERIRNALESWDEVPPLRTQKYVLYECRKWNLVWIGKNKAAPLEPDEMEMLLGYPKNHTRGGGTNRTERFKALGNSFQVDTVAFHFSVLKKMFPNGISVLSLFSGIGGAEVALDRLGIPLKNVVSVEISEINRNIFRSWWEQTNQKGNLIELEDVQQLNADKLEQLIHSLGGFDLIVGGSPCNNLTGGNRRSRDGLQGKHSALFYDYFRILDNVKCIMGNHS